MCWQSTSHHIPTRTGTCIYFPRSTRVSTLPIRQSHDNIVVKLEPLSIKTFLIRNSTMIGAKACRDISDLDCPYDVSACKASREWRTGRTEGWHCFLFQFSSRHDDVIKWKHFPRYWPFVLGIHRSPHKDQWRGAMMFSLICVWINDWVNNREAGDLRHYRAHYDVSVMIR